MKDLEKMKLRGLDSNKLTPPATLPTMRNTMLRKLLDRLKEASSWAGLAVLAQFLPIGVEELDVIWKALTAIAAVIAMLIPEGKPTKEDAAG